MKTLQGARVLLIAQHSVAGAMVVSFCINLLWSVNVRSQRAGGAVTTDICQ